MSHTDKTRPHLVRIWDPTDLAAVEHHDHRNGVCDLPETLADDLERGTAWAAGDCYLEFFYSGTKVCSCELCGGGRWARWERRAERHRANQALRRLDATDIDGWDDIAWPGR